jgi:tetratricopeptide (TPR) repeat protein
MGSALAAMFCKEFTVTLPLMLAVYEFYFLNFLKETTWKRCRRLLPFFVIVLIVPILLSRTPREAIGSANIADSNLVHNHIDITRAKGSLGRKQYFLTELNVVCTYIRLLVVPVNQNFDYDYPLSGEMNDRTLLSGVFLLCLLAVAKATYRSYRTVSFSILWFFIALSVESSFIPIGHVIAEYRVYLASVGFALLVTVLIYANPWDLKKINLAAAVILIGLSILTYQRNKVWKNEFTLWNDTVQKSPHKARAYNNRGLEYFNQGKTLQAISDFNTAIEINPDYAAAYNNRGVLYAIKGDRPQAMSDFKKAIEINPGYTDAYNNLKKATGG